MNKNLVSYVRLAVVRLLLAATVFAQESAAPPAKSCLWKVQSQSNTVYLLGSIHFLKQENYPLPAKMEMAFAEAQTLVLEINPDSLLLPSMQQFILTQGVFQGGKTLESSLAKETYALAQKRAAELGMNLLMLQSFEPWLVGLTLTAAKLQQLGLEPQYGLDRHFFEKAKAAHKPVTSLETVASQISRFDEMSLKNQEAFLKETLEEWEVIEKDLHELVAAWASGEVDSLSVKLFESLKSYPEVYASLITERNRNWLPQIERFLAEDKTYLVVVGAGHMVGAEGLIRALQGKGYSVAQL